MIENMATMEIDLGLPLSALHREKKVRIDFLPVLLGLRWRREDLYRRIESRPGADPTAPGADPGAPQGDAALGDIAGAGGAPPMGGGGGGAAIPVTKADQASEVKDAIAKGESVAAARELMEMRHYLKLLERKKELLEELQEIREKKKEELELFSHVANPEYRGFFRVQILPPEQIEITNEGTLIDGPTIYYKPPEDQKY